MTDKQGTHHKTTPTPANTTHSPRKVGLGGYLGKKSSRQLLRDLRDKQDRF